MENKSKEKRGEGGDWKDLGGRIPENVWKVLTSMKLKNWFSLLKLEIPLFRMECFSLRTTGDVNGTRQQR